MFKCLICLYNTHDIYSIMYIMKPENDIYSPTHLNQGFEKDNKTKDFTQIKKDDENFNIYGSLDCSHSMRVIRMAKELDLKYDIIYIDTFDPINSPDWLPGIPTIVSSSNVYCGRDCIDFLNKIPRNKPFIFESSTSEKNTGCTLSNAFPQGENIIYEDSGVSINHNEGAFEDLDVSLMKIMSNRESLTKEELRLSLIEKEEREASERRQKEIIDEKDAQIKETNRLQMLQEIEERRIQDENVQEHFRIAWENNLIKESDKSRKEEIKNLIREVLQEDHQML